MKKYVWVDWSCIDYKKYPFRRAFSNNVSKYEFPVDRFNIAGGRIEMNTINILREPVYDLTNLTNDFEDRWYSLIDSVADKVFDVAGDRVIHLLYSGGVDSVAILAALQRNPRLKDFVEQGKFKIAMTTTSINEYPELFHNEILPKYDIEVLNYDKLMCDPNAFLVTGDGGDYCIGSSEILKYTKTQPLDLTQNYKHLIPYMKGDKDQEFFLSVYEEARKKCPFEIQSISQYIWWISVCFMFQIDLVRPYAWSSTTDFSELTTNKKVFMFFFDPSFETFSFEYMSTNPHLENYDDFKLWSKRYIVNHFKDDNYYNKEKIFSQSKSARVLYKSKIYQEDGKLHSILDAEMV